MDSVYTFALYPDQPQPIGPTYLSTAGKIYEMKFYDSEKIDSIYKFIPTDHQPTGTMYSGTRL